MRRPCAMQSSTQNIHWVTAQRILVQKQQQLVPQYSGEFPRNEFIFSIVWFCPFIFSLSVTCYCRLFTSRKKFVPILISWHLHKIHTYIYIVHFTKDHNTNATEHKFNGSIFMPTQIKMCKVYIYACHTENQ